MVKLKILKSTKVVLSEKALQGLFEKNLDSIEQGLKYVSSHILIGTGEIDILAIDEDNNPVIIECKKVGDFDKDALLQLMRYYSWFSVNENNKHYLFSIFERNGHKTVSQDIRLIALVSNVTDDVKNACWALEPYIMLVSFSLLESPNEDEIIIAPRIELNTSEGGSSFIHQPKTEDDHFKANPHMRQLYEKFKEAILELDKNIKLNPSPQAYIAFAGKRNFCGLHVKKRWLRLELLLTPKEANNPNFIWNEKWGSWGYYHLENESKLEEALELVKKAFDKSSH